VADKETSLALCNTEELVEYIVCPAKYFIGKNTENRGARYTVRHRMQLALNDLVIRHLGVNCFEEKDIVRVTGKVFEGLKYNDLEKDTRAVVSAFTNLSNMLAEMELSINGAVMPFKLAYGGRILSSSVDLTVKDHRRGYIYPVVVDLSKTRYDPFYNPIIYKCHTVAKNMDIIGTNTEVNVLSVMSGKRWTYDKRKYAALLEVSISEILAMIDSDCYPLRVGWWCAGCYYRGICHKLMVKDRGIK
jgi:hypothetical protein